MKIENLKDLKKLIDLCQKNGVEAIEVDGVKMNLRPVHKPAATRKSRKVVERPMTTDGTEDLSDVIETDELTPEQMLFWSAGQAPEGPTGEQYENQ